MILLVFVGLVPGLLGGALLGVGAGFAWISYFETSSFREELQRHAGVHDLHADRSGQWLVERSRRARDLGPP